jgi:DNA-binding response OmpR family regulator
MTKVLVIEDDPAILRGIADNLGFEGYQVITAPDGTVGAKLLREVMPDLVILDVMMPGTNGYDLCRRARKEGIDTPIIMLTARGEETDRIVGLDVGADDYVTKPFSVGELMARVRAQLRRSRYANGVSNELRFDDVRVDFRSFEAERAGKPVDLTRKEFAVLAFLAARPSEVVRRDMLLEQVWGYEADVTTRTVDNHISALRAKLEADSKSPKHIVTVHGVGYKWIP